METLPPELVHMIFATTDALTPAVLSCVCSTWCAITAAHFGGTRGHVLPRVRAIHYGRRLVETRRWNVLDWMIDCTGIAEGVNNVHIMACAAAASDGDLVRLQGFRQRGFRWDRDTPKCAALYGHLHILVSIHNHARHLLDASACASAVKGRHLNIVGWLRGKGCLLNGNCYLNAAKNGDTKALQWLYDSGCWRGAKGDECERAAAGGHLKALEWLRSKGRSWDYRTLVAAAHGGHIDVLDWAYGNGCPWRANAMFTGVEGGPPDRYMTVLRWFHGKGLMDEKSLAGFHAARTGNMEVLEWARATGCSWNEHLTAQAASAGRLGVLQWLRAHGCPWDNETCNGAAYRGHLTVMMWARENGCPWNDGLYMSAAMGGHLHIMQWAHDHGCAITKTLAHNDAVCAEAAGRGDLAMLEWLCHRGFSLTAIACRLAAHEGHLHVLQWAREQGCPWNKSICASAAMEGHIEVIKWARENGCPWSSRTTGNAAEMGCVETLNWCVSNGCPT